MSGPPTCTIIATICQHVARFETSTAPQLVSQRSLTYITQTQFAQESPPGNAVICHDEPCTVKSLAENGVVPALPPALLPFAPTLRGVGPPPPARGVRLALRDGTGAAVVTDDPSPPGPAADAGPPPRDAFEGEPPPRVVDDGWSWSSDAMMPTSTSTSSGRLAVEGVSPPGRST